MNIREVLVHTRTLLLDFDGSVCSVFSGFSASVVADRLQVVLADNSHAAVEAYLEIHGLRHLIDYIAGRQSADPALLKPSKHLIVQSLKALGADPAECAMFGDSVSDISAAKAAGIWSIGYANKPGKTEAFIAARAEAITTSIPAVTTS